MANKVKVQQLKSKQLVVTIPRAIAEATGLSKGDVIEFKFKKGDIVIKKAKEIYK